MQPHLIPIRATGTFHPAAAHPTPLAPQPGRWNARHAARPNLDLTSLVYTIVSSACIRIPCLTHIASCCTASYWVSQDANAWNLLGLGGCGNRYLGSELVIPSTKAARYLVLQRIGPP
jgi:hypothetical protein